MILGPDGKPAHPSSFDALMEVFERFAVAEKLRQARNQMAFARCCGSIVGSDGKPAYKESDVRTGETVHVRLPARFRKKGT